MNAIRAKLLAGSVALIATLSLAAERVPGTKVTLDPPKGFAMSTQFPGYMMAETGASIMVSQIPGPIAEVAKGFTKEGLAKNGMNLLATKTVTTKTGKTTLYHVAQSARGTDYLKWIIAFGNEKETVLVVATFPRNVADEWSEKLRTSVVGARWDTSAAVDAQGRRSAARRAARPALQQGRLLHLPGHVPGGGAGCLQSAVLQRPEELQGGRGGGLPSPLTSRQDLFDASGYSFLQHLSVMRRGRE